MKTYRIIQIVASAIGLFISLRCVDSLTPTCNELLAGCMLAATSIIGLVGLFINPEVEE